MKEIELSKLDMTLYYDKLKNGLEVYLLPYDNKNNYYMSYATRYGSETTTFVPAGEEDEYKHRYRRWSVPDQGTYPGSVRFFRIRLRR